MSKLKYFYKSAKSLVAAIMLISILNGQPTFAENYTNDELNTINVYENVSPSIVSVDVDINDGISSGTGFIVDQAGTILTSGHVIEGHKKIKITLSNGEKYDGQIISDTETGDFALIKIKPKKNLSVIKLGDSSRIKVGQKVLAIGNPFGFSRTLTEGIVSRVDKTKNKIQTDAAINPGCSGGPLLNTDGEVIGINQSIYNPDNNKSNIGIGFAIPVNLAKNFINESKK
ncbi:MAG: trypsin-like peptidase domain-containing protein [bacterium]